MSDRIDLLRKICEEAEVLVKQKPTREHISAYDEAAKRLEEATSKGAANGFETQEASILYLNRQGWKIAKSKFSADYRNNLIAKRGGLFLTEDLDRYAEVNLELLDNSDQTTAPISEKELLVKEQRRKLKLNNDKEEGRLIPADEIERMLAGRAARLKADMDQFWRDHARAIVRIVGGDETKVADLIEYGQDQTDEHFSQYAEPYEQHS